MVEVNEFDQVSTVKRSFEADLFEVGPSVFLLLGLGSRNRMLHRRQHLTDGFVLLLITAN
jgi:hypothetical protein